MAEIYVVSTDFGSVTFGIRGLDSDYTEGNRQVIWYKSSTGAAGSFSKTDGWTTIYPGEMTARETMTVSGLSESEMVYVYADVLLRGGAVVTLPTVSGRSESTVVVGNVPVITDIEGTYDQTTGKITVTLLIQNLTANSSVNVQLRRSSAFIQEYNFKAGTHYQAGFSVPLSLTYIVQKDGIYRFKAYAENVVDEAGYESGFSTVSVRVKDVPSVVPDAFLSVSYADRPYSYDNGRVTGTIKDYPVITAADMGAFLADINVLRVKAGLSEYPFDEINAGDAMYAEQFGDAITALSQAAAICGVTMQSVIPSSNHTISAAFFTKLNADAAAVKAALYSG